MNFRKISYFILTNLIFSLVLNAQIPAGYYDSATGSGYTLKTQLHNIIDDHTVVSYTPGVWNAVNGADVDNYYENDGTPLDMYSEDPTGADPYNWSFVSSQCGTYGGEGDCYNREHSWPKSWFNDASPMYTDVFHLYLTDGYVNGRRSSFPFGEVNAPTWTSQNGSKVGPCSYPGYTGTVFEPIDEFKGDFARTYFYMATRYEDIISGWPGSDQLDGSSEQVFSTWSLNMLMEWHTNDPVSQKEIDRNNIIYDDVQHNRNPFIDNPNYVYQIWGGTPVPSINFVTASQQIGENIGTLTVYLSISESIPETVTANLVLTGTAADPDDYTISTTNIFFPASSTGNQSAVLTIEDDLIPEDFETIILTIDNLTTSNPDIVIGSNSEITVTINNSDGFDETPPEVDTFEVLNDSTFILTFSEQVDPVTSQLESNYIVNNGVGSPSSAVLGYLGDSAKVELSYPAALLSGSYQLTINNVEDLKSNVIALNTTVDFGISSGPGDGWIEPFEEDTNYGGSYYVGTVTFPSGDWEFDSVFIEGTVDTPYEGVQSIRLKDGTADASLTTPYINGVDSVSFYYRSYRADISMFILQKSVNGGPFENITTQAYSETSYNQFSYKVNENSDNIRIRILNDSQPERLCVDYFKVVTFSGPVQDTSPPEILTHAVTDSTLIITFSEILDPSTSQTVDNYVLDNGAGNPSAAVLGYGGDSAVVEIFYPAFLTDTNYQLTISNVEDTAANPMVTDNIDFIINSGGSGGGDGWIEDFENGVGITTSGYREGDYTFETGVWNLNRVILDAISYEGSYGMRLDDDLSGISLTSPSVNGIDSVIFYYRAWNGSDPESTFKLQKSVDTGPFTDITSQTFSGSVYTKFVYKVNDNSDNIKLRILCDNTQAHLLLDYFKVVQFPSEPPSAPANVTTQISGSDIILSWDAVSGATGYDVYSSDSPYDGFGWEASVTESSYTTPYTEARKFYYIVAKTTAKSLKSGESHERFIEIR